jgi:hypothetical protein
MPGAEVVATPESVRRRDLLDRLVAQIAAAEAAKKQAVLDATWGSFPVTGWLGAAVKRERKGTATDPVRAGSAAWDDYQDLAPMVDEYRRQQARKLLDSLAASSPLAQR